MRTNSDGPYAVKSECAYGVNQIVHLRSEKGRGNDTTQWFVEHAQINEKACFKKSTITICICVWKCECSLARKELKKSKSN